MTEKSSFPLTLALGLTSIICGAHLSTARSETTVTDDQVSVVNGNSLTLPLCP